MRKLNKIYWTVVCSVFIGVSYLYYQGLQIDLDIGQRHLGSLKGSTIEDRRKSRLNYMGYDYLRRITDILPQNSMPILIYPKYSFGVRAAMPEIRDNYEPGLIVMFNYSSHAQMKLKSEDLSKTKSEDSQQYRIDYKTHFDDEYLRGIEINFENANPKSIRLSTNNGYDTGKTQHNGSTAVLLFKDLIFIGDTNHQELVVDIYSSQEQIIKHLKVRTTSLKNKYYPHQLNNYKSVKSKVTLDLKDYQIINRHPNKDHMLLIKKDLMTQEKWKGFLDGVTQLF